MSAAPPEVVVPRPTVTSDHAESARPFPAPPRIPIRGGRWYTSRVLQRAVHATVERHLYNTEHAILIDYGCGDTPYRGFVAPRVGRYLAFDLPGNEHADEHLTPDGRVVLSDGSADAVLSTQVLEHVPDPAAYLAECRRLLRPGGKLVLSTHGHWRFHPHPTDFWRWTSQGLRKVVTEAGFDVVDWRGVLGLGAVGWVMVQDALVRRLPKPTRGIVANGCQWVCAGIDRLHRDASRAEDASIYVLVATPRVTTSDESGAGAPA